jgi:pimeloyl-ACP methyl ester carboxylesterase
LRGEADKIDTAKCAVYLLTGEYDFLTVPLSEEAARQIKGSEYELMKGLGHFPMSEDPDQFARYLLPVLAKIAGTAS